MDPAKKGIFATSQQARMYGDTLLLLKNGSQETLTDFLDFILDKEPGGPINLEK